MNANDSAPVLKDELSQRPVPSAWRPVFKGIVKCFVSGDFGLRQGVSGVEPVSPDTENHIRAYINSYGETLAELPDDTWSTSVCQWMGTHWEALVDLWTVGEGRSDMVLSVRVSESADGFRFHIHMVYVP